MKVKTFVWVSIVATMLWLASVVLVALYIWPRCAIAVSYGIWLLVFWYSFGLVKKRLRNS